MADDDLTQVPDRDTNTPGSEAHERTETAPEEALTHEGARGPDASQAPDEGTAAAVDALDLLAGWEGLNEQTRTIRRAGSMDAIHFHSQIMPNGSTVDLIDRANNVDPDGAHAREDLRSSLAAPAPSDPAFADIMVFDRNTRTWHVTPNTPLQAREILQQHGFSGPDSHADPWLTLTRDVEEPALDQILSQVYTELGRIPDAPARMVRTRWQQEAVRDAPDLAEEHKKRLQAAQEDARARISELADAGDLRAAFTAVHDHHAELRRGGFLPGPVERDPEFPDLYGGVLQQAQSRKDILDGEVADAPPQSPEERERWAQEYRCQCPHLSEQAVLEAVGLAAAHDEAARGLVEAEAGPLSETASADDGTSASVEDTTAAAAPGSTTEEATPDTAPPASEAVEEAPATASAISEPDLEETSDAPAADPGSDENPPERQQRADADVLSEENPAPLDGDPRPVETKEAPAPAAAAPEESDDGSSANDHPLTEADASADPAQDEPDLPAAAEPASQPVEDDRLAPAHGDEQAESARAATSFEREPGRLHTAEIAVGPDTENDAQDEQEAPHAAEFVLDQTDAPNNEERAPDENPASGEVHELPDRGVDQGPHTIDGRKIRAGQKKWQSAWEGKGGRRDALKATEADVYAEMRRRFQNAMNADKDVRLVLPSNDPEQVKKFIQMAEAEGYEITLSARIQPVPIRQMQGLSQLDHYCHQEKLERAIRPENARKEYDNLKKILTDAYENRSVHRIDLYPHDDNKPASSHRRVGDLNPDGTWGETTWSKHSHIKDEIIALEEANISSQDKQWINQETASIHQRLPDINDTVGEYSKAHAEINEAVNFLRRHQGLAQLGDPTRHVDVQAADGPEHAAQPDHEPGPDSHDPGPEPHPEERGAQPGVPEPRREPTGEPAPEESAPAKGAARRRRNSGLTAASAEGHVPPSAIETPNAPHAQELSQARRPLAG